MQALYLGYPWCPLSLLEKKQVAMQVARIV